MNKPERISRGGQIIRLWATLNYSQPESETNTVIDILADLYIYCTSHNIKWSQVVGQAEKWGLQETLAWEKQLAPKEGWEQRMLDAIFNADPLAVNDPEEMYCDACGAKRNATDLVPVNNDWTCPECSHAWDEEEDND